MKGSLRHAVIIFLILLVGLIVIRLTVGRPAPVPDAFRDTMPLAQATELAAKLDRPVLVFATADWCMPCQSLKRNALRDERVAKMILDRTVPVYLDVTRADDEAVLRDARSLRVEGIPALILVKDGKEVERLEGDLPAIKLLSWLEQF